ncbi:hypothetical protein SERLA73DRAFT_47203 [Serpula lacrymans var. lacrymans S7.3]|uniref:Histone-lysine N-methyltransferase, H3 lysine-36 specific n=1 Tax=Serpula lacrymans var. lacrymans (strain S7.3) TaxID=936435 RepID=F8PMT5_SERL3|nr:hypothetical protein SERLA73DRAFT_47203 [Serpula lacrymans var. lacrymans S7.3]
MPLLDVKAESPTPKSDESTPAPLPDVKPKPTGPQLIGHLPRAEEDAMRTFTEIHENHYQYGTLGRSREALESMTCDCQFEPGVDRPSDACGHGSDCINRLTQVECLPDDCRCRSFCQNQRFQRREYANINIVQTEKKGYGLRAAADLHRDAFIYEYVGDVVSHPSFVKRMREYGEQGIRHFYFMMLQKDEFIDATKRGGMGRFANHSCNPNCYVAKWTIGNHVRMGIFANRNIVKDEELTFNYNVDRYGHEAQPCYCGEAKCVGFIGGKTQTDIAAMDDLYLDALGITDEVEKLGLKGSKKKKGKKLDEDYMPILKPLLEKDIPKVIQAVRQTQSRKVLFKLLTRIKITEDQAALRQIMRLRGFSLMTNILEDYTRDVEITTVALESMEKWPLIQRNKVDDSKIKVPVQLCSESDNEAVKALAQKLLDHWETLEYAYRIPKRLKAVLSEDHSVIVIENEEDSSRPSKKTRWDDFEEQPKLALKPLGFRGASKPVSSLGEAHAHLMHFSTMPRKPSAPGRQEIAAIIAAATAAAAAAAVVPPPPPVVEESSTTRKKSSSFRSHKKQQSKEEKEANKEKRLVKLVGAIVVKCMSKHSKKMDHEQFKKHAKELTHIIAEKEKKSSSYKDGKLDALSDEKVTKIKKFSKEYIAKVLRKLEKTKRKPSSSSGTHDKRRDSSMTLRSPQPDGDDGDGDMAMTVEQAMDMDGDSASEDGDANMDGDDDDDGDRTRVEGLGEHELPPESATPSDTPHVADPRLRHRDEESGWDPHDGTVNGTLA